MKQPESYTINAMSDVVFIDHKAPKLHQDVTLEVPLRGETMHEGDNLFRFTYEASSANYEFERLPTADFSIANGKCKFKANISKGKG